MSLRTSLLLSESVCYPSGQLSLRSWPAVHDATGFPSLAGGLLTMSDRPAAINWMTDEYGRIPLNQIKIDRAGRQRREFETDDLEISISKRGVLTPIIIDRNFNLIAGERRVQACKKLGLDDIPFRFADQLSQIEAQIVELEENIKRKDLSWQDNVRATHRIHTLYVGLDENWTQQQTGDSIGIKQANISIHLKVAQQLHDPRIAEANTIQEALTIIDRRQQRLNAEAIEGMFEKYSGTPTVIPSNVPASHIGLLNGGPPARPEQIARSIDGPSPPDQTILNTDFNEWAANYQGQKFNFIHCDFPYGIDAFAGLEMQRPQKINGQEFSYKDEKAVFDKLLNTLFVHQNKFISSSAHLMFWYTADSLSIAELLRRFAQQASEWQFHKFPLIWSKSDESGLVPDRFRTPRHSYEICLLASRGDRTLAQIVGDHYAAPKDNKLHPSAKPEPVLRHFFRLVVDHTTVMLDPTCGAGSSLRAAESLGAKQVFGLELNSDFATTARSELRKARLQRELEKTARKVQEPQPSTAGVGL